MWWEYRPRSQSVENGLQERLHLLRSWGKASLLLFLCVGLTGFFACSGKRAVDTPNANSLAYCNSILRCSVGFLCREGRCVREETKAEKSHTEVTPDLSDEVDLPDEFAPPEESNPSDGGEVSKPDESKIGDVQMTRCGNGFCESGESCESCPNDCPCDDGECKKGKCVAPCGNNICEANIGENCKTCPADCSCGMARICKDEVCKLQSSCGNGACNKEAGETCLSCPVDCACSTGQFCADNETCQNACGNGKCEANEDCSTCVRDCACPSGLRCENGSCNKVCGNGLCEPGEKENCDTCAADCSCATNQQCKDGKCGESCGDRTCQVGKGETCATCAVDCGCKTTETCRAGTCVQKCGDGTCDTNENCESCNLDCGCNSSQFCDEKTKTCQALCGNGACEKARGENCQTCARDCSCDLTKEICGSQGACVCKPDCSNQLCGGDGCGGSCGSCGNNPRFVCDNNQGQCKCKNECDPNTFSTQCDGDSGFKRCEQDINGCFFVNKIKCQGGKQCRGGACGLCSCGGKVCGVDNCGNSCGSCPQNTVCDGSGQCKCKNDCQAGLSQCLSKAEVETCETDARGCRFKKKTPCGTGQSCVGNRCCTPVCRGKECGDNGCGGSCGSCKFGCENGRCKRKVTVTQVSFVCTNRCNDRVGFGGPDLFLQVVINRFAYYSGSNDPQKNFFFQPNVSCAGNRPRVYNFTWEVGVFEESMLRTVSIELWNYNVVIPRQSVACYRYRRNLSQVGQQVLRARDGTTITLKVEK